MSNFAKFGRFFLASLIACNGLPVFAGSNTTTSSDRPAVLQDADAQPSNLACAYSAGLNMGKFPEPELLVAQWKEPLTDEIREGSSWRALMNGDVDLVIRWREFFYPVVNRALGAPDADTQRLALRVVLVDSGYARARSRAFLRKGIHYKDSRSAEERRALAAKWNAGWADIAEVTREHLANVAVHECTIEMVRFIQRRGLDDATLTDYFALWDTVCGQLWNGTAETVMPWGMKVEGITTSPT
jgi:hypothetical protein